jgi:hypothetical protein
MGRTHSWDWPVGLQGPVESSSGGEPEKRKRLNQFIPLILLHFRESPELCQPCNLTNYMDLLRRVNGNLLRSLPCLPNVFFRENRNNLPKAPDWQLRGVGQLSQSR